MGRKYGFSFSAKRALGISSLKGSIARMTGIPTTRSGLYRKIGRALTGGVLSTGSHGGHKSSRKTFGVSFSLDRALGISGARGSFARATGIPTTASGLERKLGKMMVDGLVGSAPAHTAPSIPPPVFLPPAQPSPGPLSSLSVALPADMNPVPVETDILCGLCSLALFPDELICPRCAAPAPGYEQQEPRLVWIDLDALRPLEKSIIDLLGEHLDDPQLAQRLTEANHCTDEHPLVELVRHWGEFTCAHDAHSPAEQDACHSQQAGVVALHTLRHYLATLYGLTTATHPPTPLRYAVWKLADAGEHCPLCHQREGICIPVTTRRLPIIDPYCDCDLLLMPPGQEDAYLAILAQKIAVQDPARAHHLRQNAYRSGFLRQSHAQPAASGAGCAATLLVILSYFWCIYILGSFRSR